MSQSAKEIAVEILDRLQHAASDLTGDSIDDVRRAALAGLTEEEVRDLEVRMREKDVLRRFPESADLIVDLVNGEKRLVTGKTVEERAEQFAVLIQHVLFLWRDARAMFDRGRYATATFLAVACMEEVGKAGIAKMQVLWTHVSTGGRTGRSALYRHKEKHLLVAGQGALINARLDRLLGLDRVIQFLDDVEAGRIELLRQTALYADHDGTAPLLPDARISKDDALFYVTLAGELMAEVLGLVPEVWRELLDEVIEFERAQGIALREDRLSRWSAVRRKLRRRRT